MKKIMHKKIKTENDLYLKIGKKSLHLSTLNKIYFPDDGITKGDIINYYNEVADLILPYLKSRPQSLNRFANGINGHNFYQKDIDVKKTPEWLKTTQLYSKSTDKEIQYLLCDDRATLLYMINLGCIEINPWDSVIQHLEKPDWAVIDLDPSDSNDFTEVVKAALTLKKVMDELETECYCKTSGSSGLHIYIPLVSKYKYEDVRKFAELIAHTVNVQLPQTTTLTRNIKRRNKKIYIDYLQNSYGQTLAAPYSIRPKQGAPVNTPLEWKEVNKKLLSSRFTIKNILKRLEKTGDLWKPILGKGANLDKILKNLCAEISD
jgi:bifunctional non-homologous end joining protein LigD